MYHELVLTTKEYMRQVTVILQGLCNLHVVFIYLFFYVGLIHRYRLQVTELKPEWLVEIAPHYYQLKDVEDCMLFLPSKHA